MYCLAADPSPWGILLFVCALGAALHFYDKAQQQKGKADDAEAEQERLRRKLAKKRRQDSAKPKDE